MYRACTRWGAWSGLFPSPLQPCRRPAQAVFDSSKKLGQASPDIVAPIRRPRGAVALLVCRTLACVQRSKEGSCDAWYSPQIRAFRVRRDPVWFDVLHRCRHRQSVVALDGRLPRELDALLAYLLDLDASGRAICCAGDPQGGSPTDARRDLTLGETAAASGHGVRYSAELS